MSFASWCAYRADLTRHRAATLMTQILRTRIVLEQRADAWRTYMAVERRVVGVSTRKPSLDDLDHSIT